MARAHFADVAIDEAGNFLPAALVSVFARGSSDLVDVFATESSGVAMTNPYEVDDGIVSHWANAGAYDVVIADTRVPKQVQDRKIGWGAIPGVVGGIPTALLAQDAGIKSGHIENLAINSAKLDVLAVTEGKIADNAVTGGKIANGSVSLLKNAQSQRAVLTGSTSHTFSGLDGNSDGGYEITLIGSNPAIAPDKYPHIRINGATRVGRNYQQKLHGGAAIQEANEFAAIDTGPLLYQTGYNLHNTVLAKTTILALEINDGANNQQRPSFGHWAVRRPAGTLDMHGAPHHGWWEYVGNITSLQLHFDGASFTGIAILRVLGR